MSLAHPHDDDAVCAGCEGALDADPAPCGCDPARDVWCAQHWPEEDA